MTDAPTPSSALRIFAALAQPSRLAVFMEIAAAGEAGLPLQRLPLGLKITRSAITAHLHVLEAAGLISVRVGPRTARAPMLVAEVDRCAALAQWLAALRPDSAIPQPTPDAPSRHIRG